MSSIQQKSTYCESGQEVSLFNANDTIERAAGDVGKRIVDILGASFFITLLSLPMAIVALLVKLTSPGPVIFKQRRPGLGGREFWCYKFRTMVIDAEERLSRDAALRAQFEQNFKLKYDPRLTPVGAFLRKTSLDELPQFFNILNGTMSLIGPRPILQHQIVKYGDYADQLFSVKPGLGGYWQVYGRSDTHHDVRVKMDIFYVNNRSFWFDLKLLFLTAWAVFKRDGAY